MFDALVNNSTEQAATNVANAVWDSAQWAAEHGVPAGIMGFGLIYGAYRAVREGSFKRLLTSSASAALSSLAYGWGYRSYLKGHLDYLRPVGLAYLQGMMEKLAPYLYRYFDEGDVNLSARDLVPGQNGDRWEKLGMPFRALRYLYRAVSGTLPQTGPEKFALDAYGMGAQAGDKLLAFANYMSEKAVFPSKVSACFSDGWSTPLCEESKQVLRSIAYDIVKWSIESGKEMLSWGAETTAKWLEEHYGVPYNAAYYATYVAESTLLLYSQYCIGKKVISAAGEWGHYLLAPPSELFVGLFRRQNQNPAAAAAVNPPQQPPAAVVAAGGGAAPRP